MGEPTPQDTLDGLLGRLGRRAVVFWRSRASQAWSSGWRLRGSVRRRCSRSWAPRGGRWRWRWLAGSADWSPSLFGWEVDASARRRCGWSRPVGSRRPARGFGVRSWPPSRAGAKTAPSQHPGQRVRCSSTVPVGGWWRSSQTCPRRVHPARPAQRAAGVALAALVGLWAAERLPVGPTDALGVLLGQRTLASVKLEHAAASVAEDRAVVGDIVLQYVFPDYTGLDPIEVPNSDGTIHAPVGTVVQISARTATPFEVRRCRSRRDPRDVGLVGGRDLTTDLVVEGAGTWRFLLFSGEKVVLSPDYVIEVESDAAPVVSLGGDGGAVRPVDRPLGLQWSAQDDFGLERVALEVVRADGTVEEHALRPPSTPPSSSRARSR